MDWNMTGLLRRGARPMGLASVRLGILAAVLSLAVVITAGYLADRQNSALYNEQARADVAMHLSHLRADVESHLASNIQLVRGLVGVIVSEPDIDQATFASIAAELVGEHSQIRNIAGAPDLVVELMYPLAGNEAAVGLNYLDHPHSERRRAGSHGPWVCCPCRAG
jgi:sensor domain CHASE-containing protein